MDPRHANGNRVGITLLELMIVMVILVLAGAIVAPIIQRSFTSQRVSRAADLVRSGLGQARVKAMRSGEIYGFFYYPETRYYKVAPFNDQMVQVLQETQNRSSRDQNATSNFDYGDERLPNGVVFSDGMTVADSRSEDAMLNNNVPSQNIRPVLFYPDGSSQTATLMVKSESNEDFMEIRLRGMTGTSKSRTVETEQIRQLQ